MSEPRKVRLAAFVAWVGEHITGDRKGQAQIYLDRLFQAFGQKGCLEVGGTPEFRVRKAEKDGGGIAFADYVRKSVNLVKLTSVQFLANAISSYLKGLATVGPHHAN